MLQLETRRLEKAEYALAALLEKNGLQDDQIDLT